MIWSPQVRVGCVDGDLLVYAAAARLEKEEDSDAVFARLDENLNELRETCGLDDMEIYVTAKGNFRYEAYSEYKANRKETVKPRWLLPCYKYLYATWSPIAEVGYEADDLLGIRLTEHPDMLLMSYDKDLKQIAGWHFDWRKNEYTYVPPEQADRLLYLQMLQGDRADNVPGVPGIGPKKAEAYLDENGYTLAAVRAMYIDRGICYDNFAAYYKCLKILRNKDLAWPELDGLEYDLPDNDKD